jgi:serine protease inhibitor
MNKVISIFITLIIGLIAISSAMSQKPATEIEGINISTKSVIETNGQNTAEQSTQSNNKTDITIHKELQNIISTHTAFGIKLFNSIIKSDGFEKNIFISPLSISLALEMIYNGADKETKNAIAKTLGLETMNIETVNNSNMNLKNMMNYIDTQNQLKIANSLWVSKTIPILPNFIDITNLYYSAEVVNADFKNTDIVLKINNWVNDKTNGKIQKIVDKISPEDILFVINAVYFKGVWNKQFDKSETKEKNFEVLSGKTIKVPMMIQSDRYKYLENDIFQAICLPYVDDKIRMYIFLPKKEYNLGKFYDSFTVENINNWINSFRSKKGTIELPKFKIEYSIILNKALADLGMENAFDKDKANFWKMYNRSKSPADANVYIDEVLHKTFIDVNEEGTEAAAVTKVGMIEVTNVERSFYMAIDHPFFFVIKDNITGNILFMGSIFKPT